MVLKIVAIVFVPPLVAAMITIMLLNPDGNNTKMLGLMITLVILTMAFKGYDLIRTERQMEQMAERHAKRARKMKYPKPKVASDVGRTVALGVSLSMIIGLMAAGLISPKLYYTMDLISFVLMVLTVVSLSTALWYGAFPKPKKPKPVPAPVVVPEGMVQLTDGRVVKTDAPEARDPALNPQLLNATPPLALPGPAVTLEPEEMLVEIEDGESLESIKKRLKPSKPKLDLSLLASGNSYDDKVALLRFLVSEDQQRVSQALRGMMSPRR